MPKCTPIVILTILLLLASCKGHKSPAPVEDTASVDTVSEAVDVGRPTPERAPRPERHSAPKPAQSAGIDAQILPAQSPAPSPVAPSVNDEGDRRREAPKSYESEIRQRLKQLDDDDSRTRARIEALTARNQQTQRQGINDNSDAKIEITNAYNELIDIKSEQIGLAMRLDDANLEQAYRTQLAAIQAEKETALTNPI